MFYAHSDQLQLAILENGPSQMLKTHSDQVPNLKLWQAASFQYLQSVVGRIGGLLIVSEKWFIMAARTESKCGRLNPWSVEGRAPINNHLKQVAKASLTTFLVFGCLGERHCGSRSTFQGDHWPQLSNNS